jgi:signal transduction histidine kinase
VVERAKQRQDLRVVDPIPNASEDDDGLEVDDLEHATPAELRHARLAWLVTLRWWAISASAFGAMLATVLGWRFVSVPAVAGGAIVLALINVVYAVRLRSELVVGPYELLMHAATDMLVLTWMLVWSGGLHNPMVYAFTFHVVLGALLSGQLGVLFAAIGSIGAVLSLVVLETTVGLPTDDMNGVVPLSLQGLTLAVMILGLGYFALKIAQQTKGQRRAMQIQRETAQGTLQLFLDALDALSVGVEASDAKGQKLIENEGARSLERNDVTKAALLRAHDALKQGSGSVTERFAIHNAAGERLIELVALAARHPRIASAVLMVDRTETTVVEQRTIMLERLATLGRAMQGVAHELNTPLTTMRTLAKDLRAALQDVALSQAQRADVEESLDLLIEEAQRCRTLTQSLLQTASDGVRSRGQRPLIDVVTRAMRVVAAEPDSVDVDVVSVSEVGLVDADALLQVMMNLLQNALAATAHLQDDGEGARVFVRAKLQANEFVVEIIDRGPGLPAPVLARLFEPFVTTKSDGTGLGLYTCLQLIKQRGGVLQLANREDAVGCIASITLPRPPASASTT